MARHTETIDQSAVSRIREDTRAVPGVVVLFSAGEPLQGALPLGTGVLEVGRGMLSGVDLRDKCMSRRHASIAFHDRHWVITDHGSRNGTAVDGVAVTGEVRSPEYRVLRTGETLFLLSADVRPFVEHHVELKDNIVIGPRAQPALEQIRRAAGTGVLHVTGETGSGKEVAAKAFHDFGPGRAGPFVAVNCAAIPEGLAERLLFGAKKGAYSGASSDAVGYVEEADGGTLFLDEVGELDLNVQAKLLRVLETREVLALGAARPKKVDIRVCSATHRDLKDLVATGRFREDLFYRLGRPKVSLPPLRERLEEIPFLIDRQLRACEPEAIAHVSLVETCLLRPWPGNVRELMAEVRDAVFAAVAAGKRLVKESHLSPDAGQAHEPSSDKASSGDLKAAPFPSRQRIQETLKQCEGRVATAARLLGLHRNQLRRWLEKNEIDPIEFAAADDSNSA